MSNIQEMAHPQRFRDKVVLLTGCGSGAGRATALRFGLEGARVSFAARSEEHIEGAREMLERFSVEHHSIQADVSTEEGAARAVSETVEKWGGLNVLTSTAGGYEGGGFDDTDEALLERMLQSNLRTAFHAARAAAPAIAESGPGAIVITTAVFGAVVPGPGILAYNTSKAASNGLVLSLAGELAGRNIRVNAIQPGGISHDFDPDREVTAERALLQGMALPEDIAAAATFLASEEARWITGATLVVDGGFSVSRKPY